MKAEKKIFAFPEPVPSRGTAKSLSFCRLHWKSLKRRPPPSVGQSALPL